jgi:PAS domain S-box-containing protein
MTTSHPPTPSRAGRGPDDAFRGVMDGAAVAVLAADEDGNYVYANRAAQLLLGYGEDELYELNIVDLVQADPEWLASQYATLKQLGAWSGRLALRHRSGEPVQVTTNCFSYASGSDRFCVGMFNPGHLTDPGYERSFPLEGPGRGLTPSEFCLLQLLAEGLEQPQAAILLSVSVPEVRRMVRSVLAKCGASSLTEACVCAIKAGLLR